MVRFPHWVLAFLAAACLIPAGVGAVQANTKAAPPPHKQSHKKGHKQPHKKGHKKSHKGHHHAGNHVTSNVVNNAGNGTVSSSPRGYSVYYRTSPSSPWMSYGRMPSYGDAQKAIGYVQGLGYESFVK